MADPKKLAQALQDIPLNPMTAHDMASNEAIAMYGKDTQHNGPADAYRHLLWSGMMANKYPNMPVAQTLGWLHESSIPFVGAPMESNAEKQMDTTNNEYGRYIGSDAKNLDEIRKRAKILVDMGVAKTLKNNTDDYYQFKGG